MSSASWATKGIACHLSLHCNLTDRVHFIFQCQVCTPHFPSPTPCSTYSFIALYGQKLSLHVRLAFSFFQSRRQVNLHRFSHHAQQATSEKKRISTINRRPRAYTANSQQTSVPFSSSRFLSNAVSISCPTRSFSCDSSTSPLISPPTPDKTFVFPFLTLPIVLIPPQALTSPPPLPQLPPIPLHFAILRPSLVLQ
jgi:hypothetical protein